jgi:DNA-binding IclR family transcriptional regulator
MAHVPAALSGRQPQAIRTALAVLRAVAQNEPGVTAQRVSEILGIPPATTYRILNLLVSEEYLIRVSDPRGFALGPRVGELLGPTTRP